jgi:hypothetical protein
MIVHGPMQDRRTIDRDVDIRKSRRPYDQTPIKTRLSPEELNRALGLPRPEPGQSYPTSVLYRGYRIVASMRESVSAA